MLSARQLAAMKASIPAGLVFGGFASSWMTPARQEAFKQGMAAKFAGQQQGRSGSVEERQKQLDDLTRQTWRHHQDGGVAAHEAAHAAAVLYYRGALSRVTIDCDGSGYTDFRAAGLDDLDIQVIALIGAVAQSKVTGQYEIASDEDWQLCRDGFSPDPQTRRAEVAAAEGRATALVERYWNAIGALAGELILQRVLSGQEAGDVLRRNGLPVR